MDRQEIKWSCAESKYFK